MAGVVRGQYPYLEEHIQQKKDIFERYKKGFQNLPICMNPIVDKTQPNFWLSCMTINKDVMCKQVREGCQVVFYSERRKTCPTEILEVLNKYNIEGRPIWKPMHMQPIYQRHDFINRDGSVRLGADPCTYDLCVDVGYDIFERGLCLPSDNKMTVEQQDKVIDIVRACFE